MLGIAWRTLRHQPGTLVGAFLMIVIGSGLIGAFSIIQSSALHAKSPVERYAASPIAAGGAPGLFRPDEIGKVERLPGVLEVVPEVTFPAVVLDPHGRPAIPVADVAQFGHAWTSARLTPFVIDAGGAPNRDDEVVLDRTVADAAALSPGDRVRVLVAGVSRDYRLAGTATPSRAGGSLSYQRTVFFTSAHATDLAGRGDGRVDGIGVFPTPGSRTEVVTTAVHTALLGSIAGDAPGPADLPTLHVAHGAARGELEGSLPDDRTTGQTMGILTAIVTLMAISVISGALITSVRRRARALALLRAIGATPGQIRLLCQAEALMLGTLGAVAGGVLALALAEVLVIALRARGIVNPAFQVRHDLGPLVMAMFIAVLASQAAAWFTARAALRIRPSEAMSTASTTTERRGRTATRITLGALALGGAGAVQVLGMAGLMPPALRSVYGVGASGLVMIGIGLIGSWIVYGVTRVVRVPVSVISRVSGYLAAANVGFHHRRYAGVVAPLAVGIAIAGWALSSLPLYTLSTTADATARINADYVVRTPLVRDAYVGLSEELRRSIAGTAGVSATAGLWDTWGQAVPARPGSDRSVRGSAATYTTVVTGPARELLDLQIREGDLGKIDSDDGVALGVSYAQQRGIRLGDEVEIRVTGASTPVVRRVVALYERDKGGQEGLVIPGRALAGHVATLPYNRILVKTAPDAATRAETAIAAVAGTTDLTRVETRAEFQRAYAAERSVNTSNIGIFAVVLVGGFLLLAAISALVLGAVDRAGELNSLRQISAAPRQIQLMIVWEMALTIVPAWLLGVLATIWMAFLMSGGDVGAALTALPTGTLASFGAVGLITAVTGSLVTSRTAMRALGHSSATS